MSSLVREQSPVSALPPRLPRPAGFREGRWAAARLDEGDLGPSLLEVVIWFPLALGEDGGVSLAEVDAALGPATPARAVRMNKLAAEAALPGLAAGRDAEVGIDAVALGPDLVELTGPGRSGAAFEGRGFFGARVVQLPRGLVVAVRTGG